MINKKNVTLIGTNWSLKISGPFLASQQPAQPNLGDSALSPQLTATPFQEGINVEIGIYRCGKQDLSAAAA